MLLRVLLPQKWGWVQEMYAFTVSLFVIGVRHVDLILHMMAQPPWDSRMMMGAGRPYYILHYTYGNDYNADGKHTPGVGHAAAHVGQSIGVCAWMGCCPSSLYSA
jgi:hypothetical protein